MRFSFVCTVAAVVFLLGGLFQACDDEEAESFGDACAMCETDSDCASGYACFPLGGFCAKTCQTDSECSSEPECKVLHQPAEPMKCCDNFDASGLCVCN